MPYAHETKIAELKQEQLDLVVELNEMLLVTKQRIPDDPISMISALADLMSLYSRTSYIRALTKRQLDHARGVSADFHSNENAKLMEELVTADTCNVAFAYNLASGLSYVIKAQIDSIRTILSYMREERNEIR